MVVRLWSAKIIKTLVGIIGGLIVVMIVPFAGMKEVVAPQSITAVNTMLLITNFSRMRLYSFDEPRHDI